MPLLSDDFLAPYYAKGDPFPNLLARVTYVSKYRRDTETWTDTIKRVVEGNCSEAPGGSVTVEEAEALFDAFWTMRALPPGRGLWTGGVKGMPAAARYNCHGCVLRSIDDWCWVADQLMLGGGVGVNLTEVEKLGVIDAGWEHEGSGEDDPKLYVTCRTDHPNLDEVQPENEKYGLWFYVPDSREGWVAALREVLHCAFEGYSLELIVSGVRPRGEPIKTFGGIACGPGPLVKMLRAVYSIVRGAAGRHLTTLEALDITNHIGLCIKSGNVRRSALICLGRPDDQAFRDAKKDFEKVKSHRHTSNNSIILETLEDVENFDWEKLVEDNATYGEPGVVNMHAIRVSDPGVVTINPCGEIPLHHREACNLAEVFPNLVPREEIDKVLKLVTRYCVRQRLAVMEDMVADEVRKQNMRLGVGLGGICDGDVTVWHMCKWYEVVRREATEYAEELGVFKPNFVTTVKPSGTISLLNGSSPGIHAPYAPYYIRRVRIAKNEPIAQKLIEAGVPYEDCIYDSTGKTWVFAFPMSAPGASSYAVTENVQDQVERMFNVQQTWADNAVSCTIYFGPEEKKKLSRFLEIYGGSFKSISCLPKNHGYQQAPYEEITKEDYANLFRAINHAYDLTDTTVDSGLDAVVMDECAGGVCPVR